MQQTIVHTGSRDRRAQTDRRSYSMRTLAYGLANPRRRGARREYDATNVPMDWYERRLALLALAIVILSVIDAALTITLLSKGAIEANPLMSYFLRHGVQHFIIAKMMMTCVPLLLLVFASNYALFSRLRIADVLPALFLTYSGLILYESILLNA